MSVEIMSRMNSLKCSLVGGVSELKSQAKIVNQAQEKTDSSALGFVFK